MNYFFDTEFIEGFHKPLFGKRRHFIDLISIGIVADDGREYYAVDKDMDLKRAWEDDWIRNNVLAPLHDDLYKKESTYAKTYHSESISFTERGIQNLVRWHGKSKEQIALDIINFVNPQNEMTASQSAIWVNSDKSTSHNYSVELFACQPTFYAYYADYDWVLLCSLFGRMIDLPKGFPMYCRDLKQMMDEKGLDKRWKELYCPEYKNEHHALSDAKWNRQLYNILNAICKSQKSSQT